MKIKLEKNVIVRISHIHPGKALVYSQSSNNVHSGIKCYVDVNILLSILHLLPTDSDILKNEIAQKHDINTIIVSKMLGILFNIGVLITDYV